MPMSHTGTLPSQQEASSGLPCCLYLLEYTASACSCRKHKDREQSWFGGMFGPLHVGPNDCVLQEVMLGNHLLKQKAKPHLSILQALRASNSLLRRCVLTAFHVCLLNLLSGSLWARFGFHCEIDGMARNALPGSHSSSFLDFGKLNSSLNSVITTALGMVGSCQS